MWENEKLTFYLENAVLMVVKDEHSVNFGKVCSHDKRGTAFFFFSEITYLLNCNSP